MTSRWLIFFSVLPLWAATVTGRVQLRDSHDPAVRNRGDYSGVVLALTALQGTPAQRPSATHFTILQKDKTFSPHVLAIPVGSIVAFSNAGTLFHNGFARYCAQVFD